MGDEVDFLPADKLKSFLLIVSISLGVSSQASPKYPKNKFAVSLHYLKEKVKKEVDFLPADKHQKFLQIDTIILGVCGQEYSNYLK